MRLIDDCFGDEFYNCVGDEDTGEEIIEAQGFRNCFNDCLNRGVEMI